MNFIAAASSLSDDSSEAGSYRIQDGHYIIGAFENGSSQFVKLRAPNGTFKGRSIHLKPDQNCKYFQPLVEENAFIIDSADLGTFFDTISVAFYQEGWHRNYITLDSSKNHAEYLRLEIDEPTKLHLVVNQESFKLSDTKDCQYSDIELLLVKVDKNVYSRISN